jgi:hypothetical protein
MRQAEIIKILSSALGKERKDDSQNKMRTRRCYAETMNFYLIKAACKFEAQFGSIARFVLPSFRPRHYSADLTLHLWVAVGLAAVRC